MAKTKADTTNFNGLGMAFGPLYGFAVAYLFTFDIVWGLVGGLLVGILFDAFRNGNKPRTGVEK